jgi:undecaprenyl-diphosphatase
MHWLEVIVLALIQGLTEFLPISSSAHLYLAARFFPEGYFGVVFDLGLHLGTLAAVLIYFQQEWKALLSAGLAYRPGKALSTAQKQLFGIVLATIPALVVGYLISKTPGLSQQMRSDSIIGINMIVFGLLMWIAQRTGAGEDKPLSVPQMLLIGAAQAVALVPGVSRSGVTMTAALFLGLKRETAARFSFLLAVPATGLAVAKGVLDMFQGVGHVSWVDFLLGALLSGLFGYLVIHFFLAMIRKIGVVPFTVYRVLLGAALLLGLLAIKA